MLRCNIVIKNFLLDVNLIHVYVLYTIIHYVAMYEYSSLNKILLEEKHSIILDSGKKSKLSLFYVVVTFRLTYTASFG